MSIKVISVFGTRPEAIKMVPLIKELQNNKNFENIVCVTAQHREMLDDVLNINACYYGHLHGGSHRLAREGRQGSVEYHLIAGDYLNFRPQKVLDTPLEQII